MNMPPPLDEELSSPPSNISSPPSSPPHIGPDSIIVAPRRSGEGVVNPASANSAQPAAAHNTAAHNANGTLAPNTTSAAVDAPPKAKRQRKAKEPKDAKTIEPVKEKKTRKPREPKLKKEADATAAAPRKRQKTAEDKPASTPTPTDMPTASRQPTILEMVNHQPIPPPPQPTHPLLQHPPTQTHHQPAAAAASSSSLPPPPPRPPQPAASDSLLRSSLPPHTSSTPTPRPYSSGQNYDPIRGSTRDSAPPRPPAATATTTNGVSSAQASPRVNRASASPSITSLIDPPPATNAAALPTSYAAHSTLPHQHQPAQPPPFVGMQHAPNPTIVAPVSQPSEHNVLPQTSSVQNPIAANMDGAMDIDGPVCEAPPTTKAAPEIKAPSKSSSSAAPTPKAAPVKATASPKATGSGLLSSSDLLGGPSSNQGGERKGVDIEIRISLNPNGGNTINIAQEIAKKYGRDAINPRVAAHRERLLQVAAAANRLDGASADDMSVDLMSEAEGDSNVEMGGGIDEEKSATGADEKPRKRKKKVEEYDKEDDFIDDTELAWQEQAAVAKDGFFVYSGPLIAEGQTAQVESSTGTRGRGGGRGRGRGRAAASAANGTTHASLAEKKEAGTSGRGRGRGRGTGAPRKPRITKADRERLEAEKAEKAERERLIAQKAAGFTLAPSTSNPTPAPTSTPATFAGSSGGPPPNTMYPNHPGATAPSGVPV